MHTMLAARSNFSIGESILSVEGLVKQAAAAGAKVIALTDTMSVTGMIDFTNRAKKADIKPIIGCRLRLVDDVAWRKPARGEPKQKTPPEYFVTWYVLSEKGLVALFRLLSLANSEQRFYYSAKLGFDDLYAALDDCTADDVAIATSDVHSVVLHASADNIMCEIIARISAANVFYTLTPIDTPYWDTLNKRTLQIAELVDIVTHEKPQFLVTRPVCYEKGEGQSDALAVMNAVARNVKLSEPWVHTPPYSDLHALDPNVLVKQALGTVQRLTKRGVPVFGKDFVQGLANTDVLVEKAKYVWSKQGISLPKMAPDEFATMMHECLKGWKERFTQVTFGHKPTNEDLEAIYKPRLSYELSVMKKLGFAGYFLLVQDIVQFAKKNGILVGPGRGSVGGSLIAYLMGITDCDPIRFGLLFERFINPDRIDLPDADLDFMSERRGEIIQYLVEKYGTDRVAGISNFNSLAAASTIRDVGKCFGLSEDDYRCSKMAEKHHGQNIPLKKQVDLVPEIKDFAERYAPLWKVCVAIEGSVKSMGRHAAGVVIGGCDLVERAVIERRKDGATVNWDKRIVEDMGLVKVDILGLETLDLIKKTLDYIAKRHGKRVNLLRIPLDDEKVLANFAAGKTTGIFQFESGGMRRLLKELGKDGCITFDDITAATALYRPGPMDSGMMDSYWQRKQGIENVEYDHPGMVDTLKPTYGVMVYQEQVMQVSRDIAGYSMADADKLRKIMGKKLPEEMAKERGKFVAGCVKTVAMTEDDAGDLFDKIEKFAGYGFNKSHSVEYTLISYQAMWLKTNFPVEFYSAALSLMKEEKLAALLKDAQAFGITVLPPDINTSSGQFEILNDVTLCIPFNRIKGISEKATSAILKAREDGPFASKADLSKRVERRVVNIRVVTALDKVGAFARIEPDQLPSNHPDRIRDQRELIPGLISEAVPVKREMNNHKLDKTEIAKVVVEYRAAHAEDGMPVKPGIGKNCRFMVISDCPTSGEERSGMMSIHDNFGSVEEALESAGLTRHDAYWTALLKRPKEGKQISQEEIKTYWRYLDKEMVILKPPVIVLLGSGVVRHFFPDFKGKASDQAGKVIYNSATDTNFVIGFNPGEIYHDADKQVNLNEVFASVASLLT